MEYRKTINGVPCLLRDEGTFVEVRVKGGIENRYHAEAARQSTIPVGDRDIPFPEFAEKMKSPEPEAPALVTHSSPVESVTVRPEPEPAPEPGRKPKRGKR